MNFKSQETEQKLTGAYYTPPLIADFLARWVLEIAPKSILEPSCGDGAFFTALEKASTKSRRMAMPYVEGVDIDVKASEKLSREIRQGKFPHLRARIKPSDFLRYSLDRSKEELFDAIIGNPPFIRYQYVEEDYQTLTESIFKMNGMPFTKHTNAWVPFVVQGLRLLRPGGRLAMVIPTEIMHVLHAKAVRDFILEACANVHVVHIEDLFSEGVLQGVVLLLCERRTAQQTGPAVISFPGLKISELANDGTAALRAAEGKDSSKLGRKWMEGLLSKQELAVYRRAAGLPNVEKFSNIADVDVGIVTGANKFFLVPDDVVSEFELKKFAEPMFGRSNHVRGLIFSRTDYTDNQRDGLPANFLQFPGTARGKFSRKVQEYIRLGEKQGLHKRFKCRIREPWYCVPSVWASKISMLKRAHIMPRLILNDAGAYTTDTAYRIRMRPGYVGREKDFVGGFINSLTALSAELEGRHYGGGVIELVPSEIERLLVPVVTGAGSRRLGPMDAAFRKGSKMRELIREQDTHLLKEVGLSIAEIEILHKAWVRLMKRRLREDA